MCKSAIFLHNKAHQLGDDDDGDDSQINIYTEEPFYQLLETLKYTQTYLSFAVIQN